MTVNPTLRALRRTPWFAATAVLTIALGIGATASMFSVVNRVLLAPLPFRNPDRLVWIATWNAERGQYSKSSGYDFNVWQQRTEIFESVEAFWDRAYTVTGTIRPEGLVGWQFTPGLFAMLGAPAAMGRTFTPEDGDAGRDDLVVLSDRPLAPAVRRPTRCRRDDGRARWSLVHDRRCDAADVHASVSDRAAVDAGGAVDPGARRPQAAVLQGRRPAARRRDPRTGRGRATRHRRSAGQGAPGHAQGLLGVGPSAARLLRRRRASAPLGAAGDGVRAAARRGVERRRPGARARDGPAARDGRPPGARRAPTRSLSTAPGRRTDAGRVRCGGRTDDCDVGHPATAAAPRHAPAGHRDARHPGRLDRRARSPGDGVRHDRRRRAVRRHAAAAARRRVVGRAACVRPRRDGRSPDAAPAAGHRHGTDRAVGAAARRRRAARAQLRASSRSIVRLSRRATS